MERGDDDGRMQGQRAAAAAAHSESWGKGQPGQRRTVEEVKRRPEEEDEMWLG